MTKSIGVGLVFAMCAGCLAVPELVVNCDDHADAGRDAGEAGPQQRCAALEVTPGELIRK
jgi:hypothetical protein